MADTTISKARDDMTREEFLDRIDEIMCGTSNVERAYLEDLYDEVTKPHWISVEDELPSETGLYLVVQYDVVQEYWWFDGIEEWHEAFMWDDYMHSRRMEGVTHWMPIPQPPKKGGEEC